MKPTSLVLWAFFYIYRQPELAAYNSCLLLEDYPNPGKEQNIYLMYYMKPYWLTINSLSDCVLYGK